MIASKDFQIFVQEEQLNSLLIIHHWDTDGLASAAVLLNYFAKINLHEGVALMHPTINQYFFTEEEYQYIAALQPDCIVTVDLNFPPSVFERLQPLTQQLFVFDHHTQTANSGHLGVQDPRYPGCSLLLNDYLMQPLSVVSVLGMVGDQEDRIQEYPNFYPQVQQMMQEHQLSFEQMLRISKLIDTMYMVLDDDGLLYAIELLRKNPVDALIDQRLLENEKRLQTDVEREVRAEMQEQGKHIVSMHIDSSFSLISEVTREKSRQHPEKIVITDQQWGDRANLYVRRRDLPIDLGCVVELARKKEFNSGGKPEVAGVILPASELEAFREEVVHLLDTALTI